MIPEATKERIRRYTARKSGFPGPLIVDLPTPAALQALGILFPNIGNPSIHASDFCKEDHLPNLAKILDHIAQGEALLFVRGLSPFLHLRGREELLQELKALLAQSTEKGCVILTYLCAGYLRDLVRQDTRLAERIVIVEGEPVPLPPLLVFTAPSIAPEGKALKGINQLARAIEDGSCPEELLIETQRTKAEYPASLYRIEERRSYYDAFCYQTGLAPARSLGEEALWEYAYQRLQDDKTWAEVIKATFGGPDNLLNAIVLYSNLSEKDRWLYFLALKLHNPKDNAYLQHALQYADSQGEFIQNLFRDILSTPPTDKGFVARYKERRELLGHIIGKHGEQVQPFCALLETKGKEAIHYLTDLSRLEYKKLFQLLAAYDYEGRHALLPVLERGFPALHQYLRPYNDYPECGENLASYFEEYRWQKLLNRIAPEFLERVEREAANRSYNRLPARSSLLDDILKKICPTETRYTFVDALGVEYLPYIMAKCHELKLWADIHIGRCNLPSSTSFNTEFLETLNAAKIENLDEKIDKLDDIKHGDTGYDYSRKDGKLPLHLVDELLVLDGLLKRIHDTLHGGNCARVLIVSDHGASRLAVIHEKEIWEVEDSKGKNSGRYCAKSKIESRLDFATEEADYWVLANYDRFKGSRRASVEVHGGATLEEVLVPIIALSVAEPRREVRIMSLTSGEPVITVSYRAKAAIRLVVNPPQEDLSIEISGKRYPATRIEEYEHLFRIEMPDLTKKGKHLVTVYSGPNKIAEGLELTVRGAGGTERELI